MAGRAYPQKDMEAGEAPAEVREEAGTKEDEKKKDSSANLDMSIVYGQYNNMQSAVNISQQQEDFVYLLGADFKKSNDYGYNSRIYENTGFYENRISFTGNLDVFDTDKLIVDAGANNDSRGMFDNSVYSREEKDWWKLSGKYIFKRNEPFEAYALIKGADFKHRLQAVDPLDKEKSNLNNITAEGGGEYIWSASNRIRGNIQAGQYSYYGDAPQDWYLSSEVIDDFNLTRNIGISLGMGYDMNRDSDTLYYPLPIVGMALRGYKSFSLSLLYRYDIVPFKAEEFYFQQKYILPSYDLPPGKIHHGDMRMEVRLNDTVSLKGSVLAERNSAFYNYRPAYGNVLNADTLAVTSCASRVDSVFTFYEKALEITISFEYTYFDASKNITYRPRQNFIGAIEYNSKTWKVEWSNKLLGEMYTDPDTDDTLKGTMIGYFGIQRRVLEGFYGYIKVENLYNNKYSLRAGYPEPGITFLGGLRILI